MIPAATLDRCILRILDGVDAPDVAHEIDVLVRLGALKGRAVTVQHAAERLDTSTQWLSMRLRAAGAPTSAGLLAWGRLISAMHLWCPVSPKGRGIDNGLGTVASRLGWSDQFVLSRRFYAHAGINPSTWAKRGASLDDLCDLLIAKWRERAEAAA